MNAETRNSLIAIGADIEGTMDRFLNNEELYVKFLKKFLDDENFSILEKSLKEANYDDAFSSSHTLKGVSANLGLNGLTDAVSPLVEKLRAKDFNDLDSMFEKVSEKYHAFIDVIKTM
ncbi:HPt (histidine-containing phosphotransfer) domain-containing protein [Acetitomaculum ruminis DSM 5522]|uniref:HPt (Histidine-containing phosphotransfer) domain-containing protein n=1 Tax=Acetitomaculum ruminis DSM 5522 TaxID=1120918 RepID=A0A1I0V0D3_9FIRM|nr:Hpt domain-containing protein [Acetitomaculum ruminis]SFA69487.1 HPt (histidine-containing phosphotransfer) domain-containing protein [Acetitomaculum ruminis DSM 5522]